MRDVEFLPDWYPRHRAKRRRLRWALPSGAAALLATFTAMMPVWSGAAAQKRRAPSYGAVLAAPRSEAGDGEAKSPPKRADQYNMRRARESAAAREAADLTPEATGSAIERN
jgi:hypothetical protein